MYPHLHMITAAHKSASSPASLGTQRQVRVRIFQKTGGKEERIYHRKKKKKKKNAGQKRSDTS